MTDEISLDNVPLPVLEALILRRMIDVKRELGMDKRAPTMPISSISSYVPIGSMHRTYVVQNTEPGEDS